MHKKKDGRCHLSFPIYDMKGEDAHDGDRGLGSW